MTIHRSAAQRPLTASVCAALALAALGLAAPAVLAQTPLASGVATTLQPSSDFSFAIDFTSISDPSATFSAKPAFVSLNPSGDFEAGQTIVFSGESSGRAAGGSYQVELTNAAAYPVPDFNGNLGPVDLLFSSDGSWSVVHTFSVPESAVQFRISMSSPNNGEFQAITLSQVYVSPAPMAPVPETSTWATLMAGLVAVAGVSRRTHPHHPALAR